MYSNVIMILFAGLGGDISFFKRVIKQNILHEYIISPKFIVLWADFLLYFSAIR